MPDSEIFTLTRREKKIEARRAVMLALRCANGGVVRADGDEFDLHTKTLEVITHYGFSSVPLDRRDVSLAIWWLHEHKLVRESHHGPHGNRSHIIVLIRH